MGTLNDYFSEHENLGAGTLPSDSKEVELTNVNEYVTVETGNGESE